MNKNIIDLPVLCTEFSLTFNALQRLANELQDIFEVSSTFMGSKIKKILYQDPIYIEIIITLNYTLCY